VHPGGYPGALRELLGLTVEEFQPLHAGETVGLDGGLRADVWCEDLVLSGAVATHRYLDGPAAGGPAITRHAYGEGQVWYVSTRLGGADLDAVLRQVYGDAQLPVAALPDDVEVVRRTGDAGDYLVAINHGDRDAELEATGVELFTGAVCTGRLLVPAGDVRVLREHRGKPAQPGGVASEAAFPVS
jgi:beta-galactosidase